MPEFTHGGLDHAPLGTLRPRAGEPRAATPIDWSHLSRFTLGDRNLEREVLGLFAKEAPRYLARMQAAASRKDWIDAAHTLKGSARAVGAWAVADCAEAAEALQISAQREAATGAVNELNLTTAHGVRQALERLQEAVRRTLSYIDALKPPEAGSATPHLL